MESIRSRIKKLDNELFEMQDTIRTEECSYPKQKSLDTTPSELPDNLIEFYKEIEKFELKWEANETLEDGSIIRGSVSVLSAKQMIEDSRLYLSPAYGEADPLRSFKIVDLFYEKYCVGYIKGETATEIMHYLEIGNPSSQSMALDFNGYLEVMLAAKGKLMWQLVILHLVNQSAGRKDPYDYGVEEFKTFMPQLFPDFKWEDFVDLYERVRIK